MNRSRGWAITIHTPTDERKGNMTREAAFAVFEKIKSACTYIIAGDEESKEKGPHLQTFVQFENARTFNSVTKLFPTCHVGPIKYSPKVNEEYCKKTANIAYEYGTPPAQGHRSDWDAIKEDAKRTRTNDMIVKYPEYVNQGLEKVVRAVRTKHYYELAKDEFTWQPAETGWQYELLCKLRERPDHRKILWRWEPNGDMGKSAFAKWLMFNMDAFITDSVKKTDVAYAYDYQPIVVFTLPRQCEEFHCIYGMLESFADATIFSGKYNSELKVFPRVHRVVFANFPPDESQMSRDRWDVVRVTAESDPARAEALRSPGAASGPANLAPIFEKKNLM